MIQQILLDSAMISHGKGSKFAYIQLISMICLLMSTILSEILDPKLIQPLMFTEEISGNPKILIPTQTKTINGRLAEQRYIITMVKASQKMLPGNYSPTPLYVYSGMTASGNMAEFPGPSLLAKKNVPIKVVWVNNITQKHMLPIDFSQPFIDNAMFRNQVPVVPHAHGVAVKVTSDGQPGAYWTASGAKSEKYKTQQPCKKNEAVYIYPNEQDPGLFWYHDHTYGITRTNVYAGLAGFYQILDDPSKNQSFAQANIAKKYGQNLTKLYFTIADKTFNTDGSLYYPNQSPSAHYTSWVPQFYADTIVVNGKVWPKVVLQKKRYRMIFLNACQCRYLNIYFLHLGKKLPFELIRLEGDYFPTSIAATQYLLSLSARLQIILDLTQINGEIFMKNNAAAPYPNGDPDFLIDKFTGTIMKIQVKQPGIVAVNANEFPALLKKVKNPSILKVNEQPLVMKENAVYPAFKQGEIVYTTLSEVEDENLHIAGMFIDGAGMQVGANCQGSVYEANKVYDLHIINLTPDSHPIHFHLINFQKVYSFPIDVQRYTNDWYDLNGGAPSIRGYNKTAKHMDPRMYQIGSEVQPKSYEKVFRDVIDAHPDMVTVVRMKFSHNNGQPFGFPVSGSRYVWHCHMLQHEDNQMMKYFCVK